MKAHPFPLLALVLRNFFSNFVYSLFHETRTPGARGGVNQITWISHILYAYRIRRKQERMKEITNELQHSVRLLEENMTLCDVIDNHIDEQTLVRYIQTCFTYVKARYNGVWNSSLFSINLISFPLCQAEKNAFFIADLGVVMRQHVRWRTRMAQIRPYYSVRCNSRPTVIDVLAALGTGFICTNKVFSRPC